MVTVMILDSAANRINVNIGGDGTTYVVILQCSKQGPIEGILMIYHMLVSVCKSSDRVETTPGHDARAGSHSRTAPERRPTYVYCMEINNWPPYSSFDELSGGSIMSV
ncbi:hypothetical protein HW555_005321 [Spodoptera exigua]|uniref:Uncharacterized protein n=1 Tax=Spodoptera exigua TaxID=7107 RepID=A0A835GLE6_SPOEX|nr:hypothetical protein HW555_005321 [Spodoptera exigua]